jgi:hypothetical protein
MASVSAGGRWSLEHDVPSGTPCDGEHLALAAQADPPWRRLHIPSRFDAEHVGVPVGNRSSWLLFVDTPSPCVMPVAVSHRFAGGRSSAPPMFRSAGAQLDDALSCNRTVHDVRERTP